MSRSFQTIPPRHLLSIFYPAKKSSIALRAMRCWVPMRWAWREALMEAGKNRSTVDSVLRTEDSGGDASEDPDSRGQVAEVPLRGVLHWRD